MESVYLAGSEEVGRAAGRMNIAAEQMKQAANQIECALIQHQQFLDMWLTQFKDAMAAGPAPKEQK